MKKNTYNIIKFLIIFISILLSFNSVFAEQFINTNDYLPLTAKTTSGLNTDFSGPNVLGDFLGAVFNWGIAVAVVLALVMIIWGGIEYMTTDSWGGKDEGRKRISDALQGLALALVSYLLLYTINPCLVIWTAKDGCASNTFLHPAPAQK